LGADDPVEAHGPGENHTPITDRTNGNS
jgi:hypothetical protein